jgi:hypothetical protein
MLAKGYRLARPNCSKFDRAPILLVAIKYPCALDFVVVAGGTTTRPRRLRGSILKSFSLVLIFDTTPSCLVLVIFGVLSHKI